MTVFKMNLLRTIRRKSNFFAMLLVPVIFIVFLFMFSVASPRYRVVVVDNDNTRLTELFVKSLAKNNCVIMRTEENATQLLIERRVERVITIPRNFTSDIIKSESPMINTKIRNESIGVFATTMIIENFMNTVENIAFVSEGDLDKFYTGVDEYLRAPFGLTTETFKFDYSRIAMDSGIGTLLMGMLFFSSAAAGIIIDDKESKVIYRLMATPLSIKRYMLENIACFFAILLAQITIIMISLNLLVGIAFQRFFSISTY